MKRFLMVLTVLVLVFALAACGGKDKNTGNNVSGTGTEETGAVAGELKDNYVVGLDDTFVPMGFRDEKGEIVGFDVDLAKEVANRCGFTVEFQPIDWNMKEAELQGGNIDFIWNGYTITPERQEKVAFSDPYLQNRQVIIVMADSPVEKKADLAGKTVTVQGESSALDAVMKDGAFVEGLKEPLVEFPTNLEAFKDVEAGRSDAIVVDEVLARDYMKKQGQEKYRVLDEDFGAEEYGVGMRKEDTALVEAVNKALEDMKADGTFEEIQGRWMATN